MANTNLKQTGAKRAPVQLPHNPVHLHRDRGYRFRERDPILTEICTLITTSGLSCRAISRIIVRISGGGAHVSPQTLYRWLDGTTQRPQNFCLDWAARALGYERKFVPIH